jgi:hypothetical protein
MAATPVSAASCHIVEHPHQGRIVRPRTIGEITEMNSRGFPFASGFGRQQCFAKSNHSKERRAPLSKQRKVIDKPTQHLPLKYAGDAMTIGATTEIHPYPAVIQVSLAVA